MTATKEIKPTKRYRKLHSLMLAAGWDLLASSAGDDFLQFLDPHKKITLTMQFSTDLVDVYPDGLWVMRVRTLPNTICLETKMTAIPTSDTGRDFLLCCYNSLLAACEPLANFVEMKDGI